MERLAKALSVRGFCSRRDAEKIIEQGRVKVNGEIVKEVITFITDQDTIEVDNVILSTQKPRLWVYYKPRGLVTTHKDPEGRPTVFDNIKIKANHIMSVGRLDIESEGLLLLTNSGELARFHELPSNNFQRVYRVKAYGKFRIEDIQNLQKGIEIDGIKFKPCKIMLIKSNNSNHWFEVTLSEGKNREIRKIFESITMKVNRLIRIRFDQYELGNMKAGEIKEVEISQNKNN